MPNEIIIDGKIFKLESVWRCSKIDTSKDTKGKKYPFPKEGKNWSGRTQFIKKLLEVQNCLYIKKNTIEWKKRKCRDCLICKSKNIINNRFILGNYVWDDGLLHYIKKHNIKPSDQFIDIIFSYKSKKCTKVKIKGEIERSKTDSVRYLKVNRNQLMILDALMVHGGYNKKYDNLDDKKNIIRYSEHAGFLDVKNDMIYNIIVSGNTIRVDRGDEEIFLPMNTPDAFKYEYIFHTHPPTPKPGGRAVDGILYEFPSMGDIFHFIDHFNGGKTIGSLVMTPEGLYNIRTLNNIGKKIKIDEDKFFDTMRKKFRHVQDNAINKYGSDFTTYYFYKTISQDKSFIDDINSSMADFQLTIDFFPRIKNKKGSWIVDTIYTPIFDK
jgi:hypothetical protein